MQKIVQKIAGLSTLFTTLTLSAAAQTLIRRGSEEEAQAKRAQAARQVLAQENLHDDTAAILRTYNLPANTDHPLIAAYDNALPRNVSRTEVAPSADLCIVHMPALMPDVQTIVNAGLPPYRQIAVEVPPGGDKAFAQIFLARAEARCDRGRDDLEVERAALQSFLKAGGEPELAQAHIDWLIVDSLFSIAGSSPTAPKGPDVHNLLGVGLALKAEQDGTRRTLDEGRALNIEAIRALRDYADRHVLQYGGQNLDARLGKTVLHDLVNDATVTIEPAVLAALKTASGAADRLIGDTVHPVIQPVVFHRPATEPATEDDVSSEIFGGLTPGQPAIRDAEGLLAAVGLTLAEAQEAAGPAATVNVVRDGDIPAGEAAADSSHKGITILRFSGDGIAMRDQMKRAGLGDIVIHLTDRQERDLQKLTALHELEHAGQGDTVAVEEIEADAETKAIRHYLDHGGDPETAAGRIAGRALISFYKFYQLKRAGRDSDNDHQGIALPLLAAFNGTAPTTAAEGRAATRAAVDVVVSYLDAHKNVRLRKMPDDLAPVIERILADDTIAMGADARAVLQLADNVFHFLKGEKPLFSLLPPSQLALAR